MIYIFFNLISLCVQISHYFIFYIINKKTVNFMFHKYQY